MPRPGLVHYAADPETKSQIKNAQDEEESTLNISFDVDVGEDDAPCEEEEEDMWEDVEAGEAAPAPPRAEASAGKNSNVLRISSAAEGNFGPSSDDDDDDGGTWEAVGPAQSEDVLDQPGPSNKVR